MPFVLRNLMRVQFRLMPDRSPMRKGILRGFGSTARDLARILAQRDEIVQTIDRLFDRFDVWLCPVTAAPAFPHQKSGKAVTVDGRRMSYFVAAGGYTTPFNVTGHPVVVAPVGHSVDGLPIGLQIVGPRWSDERLLAMAASLDQVAGQWRRPPEPTAALS